MRAFASHGLTSSHQWKEERGGGGSPCLHGGALGCWCQHRHSTDIGTSAGSRSTGEQGRVRVRGCWGASSVSLHAACACRMIMYVKRKVYVTHIKGV